MAKKANSAEAEMNIADLETANTETTTTTAKKSKELSPEDIASLNSGIEKLRGFGVSDNMGRVLEMVAVWHEKDTNKPVKDEVIEQFGGSENFKNYIDGDFQDELNTIMGINKAASTLNNIKSFYARRKQTKPKFHSLVIDQVTYDVNADFFFSLTADMTRDEKVNAILAHPDTKENKSIETL